MAWHRLCTRRWSTLARLVVLAGALALAWLLVSLVPPLDGWTGAGPADGADSSAPRTGSAPAPLVHPRPPLPEPQQLRGGDTDGPRERTGASGRRRPAVPRRAPAAPAPTGAAPPPARTTAAASAAPSPDAASGRKRTPARAQLEPMPHAEAPKSDPAASIVAAAAGNVSAMRAMVAQMNAQQIVLNADRFPNVSRDRVVIVVQVHNRAAYLRHLLESLGDVVGIEEALLVVSHDYASSEMLELVRQRVIFARCIQIFFPWAMQLFPDRFPGTDSRDCARDQTKQQAKQLGCLNAETPDMYGHYREARFTMIKHHWWWKLNTVFDGLRETRHDRGLVLLLEEDHFVAPDLLLALRLLARARQQHCPDCNLLNAGNYLSPRYAELDRAYVAGWTSNQLNIGFAFDRAFWRQLRQCSQAFCSYDDYNWDWTLQSLSYTCLPAPVKSLVATVPRVFHIGACGMHWQHNRAKTTDFVADMHQHGDCDATDHVRQLRSALAANRARALAITEVRITDAVVRQQRPSPNGGWADPRDIELCMSYVVDPPAAATMQLP